MSVCAFRAHILHCLKDPGDTTTGDAFEYFADGLLLVENGCVTAVGPAPELLARQGGDVEVVDYSDKLIVPGFIDTHIHYVQTDVIAAHGRQLLDWLETYTFPAERRFADTAHAQEVAQFFVRELLRNGTTMALVLGSVHATSVDAVFQAAADAGMRLIAGKVMMDRNCPDYLRDTPQSGYTESRELIERWHKRERLLYAITPRFAPTSSDAQLQRASQLAKEFEDVYVHTHLAENRDEVAWVQKLFPWSRSYLDVYDHYGLLRERSLYAHSIHLDDADRERFVATGAAVSFCPTCNLFIGSGLFDLREAWRRGMRVGLGTDVGGGTTFNMLQVLNEAYKVAQLQGFSLSPLRALYLATLAGAEALYLDDRIGNLQAGKEADFVVLDRAATPLLARRTDLARDIDELLFALIMLGDDRCIEATYLRGECAHQRT
ncbi:MAG: guanine deaminase [Gammaproteobacteria bacterium]|nr:guanine deaminase [Gammaproteobacteria bacterium]